MCTGGEYRGVRQDRHFSAASSFQIGISRGRRIASSGRLARVLQRWHSTPETRPLVAFAGIWTEWNGVRGTKANPAEGRHRLYGFLTTEPNSIVAPIHAKAMPVILTTPEEWDVWMRAPSDEASQFHRSMLDALLQIFACAQRQRPPPPRHI